MHQSDALPYESSNPSNGTVETHFVCSQTCLVDVFNEHLASGGEENVLKT